MIGQIVQIRAVGDQIRIGSIGFAEKEEAQSDFIDIRIGIRFRIQIHLHDARWQDGRRADIGPWNGELNDGTIHGSAVGCAKGNGLLRQT